MYWRIFRKLNNACFFDVCGYNLTPFSTTPVKEKTSCESDIGTLADKVCKKQEAGRLHIL